jgi:predicted ABC-type ATPase
MSPVLIVIAGPNGSGKTTITERLRSDHWSDGVTYVNPDEIARDRFGDWNNPTHVLEAARFAQKERERLLGERQSIAFETVLSMPDKLEFIQRAREAGYFVRGFFVATESPIINAARVAGRVLEGGHSVPLEKIISRYSRALLNLPRFIHACERAYLYDNSVDGKEAELVVRFIGGKQRKKYVGIPDWMSEAVVSAALHPQFEDLTA